MKTEMQLTGPIEQPLCNELDVINRLLPLDGAVALELGCGTADKTRLLAEKTGITSISAAEVDQVQHERNLAGDQHPRITFDSFGAEAIDAPDNHFDVVFMFKSLHHVPFERLDDALEEIHRVLKPGGCAWISEPVFEGDFNEVMRVFHDEETVRIAAFETVKRAVSGQRWQLVTEQFFRNPIRFRSWEQYEKGVLGVTHTDHQLTPELHAEVRARFMNHKSEAGFCFQIPNRVDVLRPIKD